MAWAYFFPFTEKNFVGFPVELCGLPFTEEELCELSLYKEARMKASGKPFLSHFGKDSEVDV